MRLPVVLASLMMIVGANLLESTSHAVEPSLLVTQETVVEALDPQSQSPGQFMTLPKGLELIVLETDSDPLLGDLVRIGLDSREIWVRATDLSAANLASSPAEIDPENPVLSAKELDAEAVLTERDLLSARHGFQMERR